MFFFHLHYAASFVIIVKHSIYNSRCAGPKGTSALKYKMRKGTRNFCPRCASKWQ